MINNEGEVIRSKVQEQELGQLFTCVFYCSKMFSSFINLLTIFQATSGPSCSIFGNKNQKPMFLTLWETFCQNRLKLSSFKNPVDQLPCENCGRTLILFSVVKKTRLRSRLFLNKSKYKKAGHHRHLFRPLNLLKIPFTRMKAFSRKITIFSKFW